MNTSLERKHFKCFFYYKKIYRTYTSYGDYMSLKKIKIISFFIIILLSVLFHFLYEWFPNIIFSIIFPVNESIWEHMKLLYSGFIIWGIFEYIILKKCNITFYNYFYQLFLISITSILFYLIMYIPLYQVFGENIFISIGLLIIVILLEEIFSYNLLLNYKRITILNKFSVILILLFYIVFGSLTYNPLKNYLFYDILNNKYGINIKM